MQHSQLHAAYDPLLVVLSFVVATLASYTALDLAGRVTAARSAARVLWLFGGAVAMGVGIWAMHFIGMLAFSLPVPVSYDPTTVAQSVGVAMGVSLLALVVVSRPTLGIGALLIAGLCMGLAIAGMHYTGMAAMRMPAHLGWNVNLVAASIGIAITASVVALRLAFSFRSDDTRRGRQRRALAAVVMGIAIAGMHYTGMAAGRFTAAPNPAPSADQILPTSGVVIAVVIAALTVLSLALTSALLDRSIRARAQGSRRHRLHDLRLETGIVGLGVLAVAMLIYSIQVRSSVHERAEAISRIGDNMRSRVALAHLWLEEAIAGDTTVDVASQVTANLRIAAELCAAQLDGGTTPFGTVPASEHAEARMATSELCRGVADLRRQSDLRLADDVARHSTDPEFDHVFNAVLARSRAADTVLARVSANSGRVANWIDASLIVLLGGLTLATAILVRTTRREMIAKNAELQRLAGIVESSGDAISSRSLDGRILSWNRGAERLYGYAAAEIIGESAATLLADPDAEPASGLLENSETICRRRDGSMVVVSVTESPVHDEEGAVVAISAIARDMTERKQAEAAQQAARAAAEAASRAKSEFLANMSHEIRTPMNGVLGMLDLAMDTELTAEQREYVSIAKGSADSLLAVINDILDFSKIEAGKLDLESIDFSIRDTLADAVSPLALRADAKGLELSLDVAPEVPRRLAGDPGRLRQIVTNLVGNAIKFTEHGEVSVMVSVDAEYADAIDIHCVVRDTGIGIVASKHLEIFDAFAQADGSTTRAYGGTGLGLSISAQLVAKMGGRIWVESAPGEGSRFHFTARLGRATSSPPADDEAGPDLRGRRILVVDDNATNRRLIENIVARHGARSATAEDAFAALAALERANAMGDQFSIVLLDSRMPGLDGFSLVERIQQNAELRNVSIMMLTSSGQRGDAARCRSLNIAAYLVKPIRPEELTRAIQSVLAGRSAAPGTLVTQYEVRGEPMPPRERRVLKVLLAEDNRVNQELGTRLLRKRGHDVTVVGNGRDAVQALLREPFDVVLMDVQMPEMGGFEATREMRAHERRHGGHVPIVAMTAHAMKGDREACLAAGMDAYVSKPISPRTLFDAIDTALGVKPMAAGEPISPNPDMGILDAVALLDRAGGERELVVELVRLFHEDTPARVAAMLTAIARRDAVSLRAAAHALRGSASSLAALEVQACAHDLESIAENGDWLVAQAALTKLQEALNRLRPALDRAGVMVST